MIENQILVFSQEPVIAKEVATFFPFPLICCVKSGPLEMVARTPVGGYAPGQTIELNFTANNQSDRPIETFKLQLIKVSICVLQLF